MLWCLLPLGPLTTAVMVAAEHLQLIGGDTRAEFLHAIPAV